ncbi:MAG TPA: hypothetical protein VGR95_20025, partial [Thermoanaerobaculia bacterium]|nr:hypothetical protein [Thermoanaerobaculia bacterium]
RDTADKVRIAQKIIEANDKAKAEVVVDVELLQMDLDKTKDIGFALAGISGSPVITQVPNGVDKDGNPVFKTITAPTSAAGSGPAAATLADLANITHNSFSFAIPQPTYGLLKSVGNAELLANPELRISEGEKASLHIGQRIPVPVSTFTSATTGTTNGGTFAPVTSYQYQDVGIKVAIEPRVHHNGEVTLKLTVEVSNVGQNAAGTGVNGVPAQPTFATRTIESTIRLKDGETNFLAGLIQDTTTFTDTKTPFLGDIPILGRLFTESNTHKQRTDLVLTMTPHIVRMPDITEDDVAPMWVGTQNNLTFRGVSPRIESQSNGDPFVQQRPPAVIAPDGQVPMTPDGRATAPAAPLGGSAPSNPFQQNQNNPPNTAVPPNPNPPQASVNVKPVAQIASMASTDSIPAAQPDLGALRIAPRLGAEPVTLKINGGEQKLWNIIGMDLEGLSTDSLVLHYDRNAVDVTEVVFGEALAIDPKVPPVATINRETGTIKITSSDGKPLQF